MAELDGVFYKEIVEQALREFPNEACGLIAAEAGVPVKVYAMTNADASPATYRLDGKEQTQADLAHPSETNTTQAMWDGDKIVIIVKLPNGTPHRRILTMQPDGTMLLEMIASVDGKPAETFKAVHKKK